MRGEMQARTEAVRKARAAEAEQHRQEQEVMRMYAPSASNALASCIHLDKSLHL